MATTDPLTIDGVLNFAADRSDGGEFSNRRPDRIRQNLTGVEVEIRNARLWPEPPTLAREGLCLAHHPVDDPDPDWTDAEWWAAVYVPTCVELVKELTGARHVIDLFRPLIRRADYADASGSVPTADFIHIDQTRAVADAMAGGIAKAQGLEFERAAIYNVWKAITPPPQDIPLAVSDMRSIEPEDHVLGRTLEWLDGGEDPVVSPYVTLAPSSNHPIWYYVPDLGLDESLVFVGTDLDPTHPLGCAHTAFRHPEVDRPLVHRVSIETRVFAIFE